MRFAFIAAEEKAYPVTILCRVLKVTRSGYYAWRQRPVSARAQADERDQPKVRAAFVASRGTYGSPRVTKVLQRQGIETGRTRVARLMRDANLVARPKKKFRCLTNSRHDHPLAPNLVNQEFTVPAPNHTWVADTTELTAGTRKFYLAAVLDLFSRALVGWAIAWTNDAGLTCTALRCARRKRNPPRGLIHHSDRGSTYTARDFRDVLAAARCQVSMSGTGNCYDNAVMESWFSTLKTELGDTFMSFEKARSELFRYIDGFYNRKRLHSTLDYQSPIEYERSAGYSLAA